MPRLCSICNSCSKSTVSLPHSTTSVSGSSRSRGRLPVAISVGASPCNTRAERGVRSVVSSTTRSGLLPGAKRGSSNSRGSSCNTVPIPTITASHSARNVCTLWWSSPHESRTGLRFASAIFPSSDAAQFTTTCGRSTGDAAGREVIGNAYLRVNVYS